MSFMEALAFEIASTRSELETAQKKVKECKKKLRSLEALLEEMNRNTLPEENNG